MKNKYQLVSNFFSPLSSKCFVMKDFEGFKHESSESDHTLGVEIRVTGIPVGIING